MSRLRTILGLLLLAAPDVATRANQTDAIDHIDYDWSLNRPENFPELSQ
ncbi:hypothetical protein [Marinobacter sp. OP 3.4]